MKKLMLIGFILLIANGAQAQTVDEIMQHSIQMKRNDKLFLKLHNDQTLGIAIGQGNQGIALDFEPFDQTHPYILPRGKSVNPYIIPVNPLSFHIKTTTSYRADSIQVKFDDALKIFITRVKEPGIKSTSIMDPFNLPATNSITSQITLDSVKSDCSGLIEEIKKSFNQMEELLKNNQKNNINQAFTLLKNMTFETEKETAKTLSEVNLKMDPIRSHFKKLDTETKNLVKLVSEFNCDSEETKFLFSMSTYSKVKDILAEQNIQFKRLEILENAYAMTDAAYIKASRKLDNIEMWHVPLPNQLINTDKITDFAIEVEKSGLTISEQGEIVKITSEPIKKFTISLRKFSHFIPEIAAGVVYSDLPFQNFGTGTDEAGNIIVADAGREVVSKFSVASMINLNYFFQNSPIHPFLQFGIGVNADYQTLLIGGGIRLTSGLKRFSISGGMASPWYNKLTNLKIGDQVTGTADIEKDYTKDVAWFKRGYIGIQYKL